MSVAWQEGLMGSIAVHHASYRNRRSDDVRLALIGIRLCYR